MFMPGNVSASRVACLLSCLPWLAFLGWTAGLSWFLCDEAFISFRYARNLLEGHGLVFNPGEYVEGYSNFLWVLELAALRGAFGLEPDQAAPWLSVACTAGTVAAMLWWVARTPSLHHRKLVAWMALGLVCSSATFAVWTSGGGFETRQFTLFVVLAVVCLSLYRNSRRGLLAASLSLAAAACTRPEGPLLAACCFAWFAMQRRADTGRWRPARRDVLVLVGPFAFFVAAHYLFRYGYYGEWLPNAWYARDMRPWYGSGFFYLAAAALETGLYLLLPLAWMAHRERWRTYRDGTYALALLCVGVHMLYVMRIGGDHFEYRPLDFYWPLLAVPAAVGIVRLGTAIANRLGWSADSDNPPDAIDVRGDAPGQTGFMRKIWDGSGRSRMILLLFIPVLFYSNAIQGALLFEGAAVRKPAWQLHIELDKKNAGWLLGAPGMPMLVAISNRLRRESVQQNVGKRFVEHRAYTERQRRRWEPYAVRRGLIPDDAVMARGRIGVQSWYLPDVEIVDLDGLTDKAVARRPSTRPEHRRGMMTKGGRLPRGYLEERGVNFWTSPPSSSEAQALGRRSHALRIEPDVWMPFDTTDHRWATTRFSGRGLRTRSQLRPADSRFEISGHLYVGERFLGRFDDGMDGWSVEGEAVTNSGESYTNTGPIIGNVGPGFLTSRHPEMKGRAIGKAFSPEFTARADQSLVFLSAGGGRRDRAGVRLWADDEVVSVWSRKGRQRFRWVVYPLYAVAGKSLRLELFDSSVRGHVMLDHVLLMRHSPPILTGKPVRLALFDVYFNGTTVTYVNSWCTLADTERAFFVHVWPVDEEDLPDNGTDRGFEILHFDFDRHGVRFDEKCIMNVPLPDYDVAHIRTGQRRAWKVDFPVGG